MSEERIWEADPTSGKMAADKNSQSDSKLKHEVKRKPERYMGVVSLCKLCFKKHASTSSFTTCREF